MQALADQWVWQWPICQSSTDLYWHQSYEISQVEAALVWSKRLDLLRSTELQSSTQIPCPSRWIQPQPKFSVELLLLIFYFRGKHFLEICIIFVVVTRAGVACRCVGGSRSGPWTTAAKFHRSTYSLHPILLAHTLNMQTHTLTAQTACIHGY